MENNLNSYRKPGSDDTRAAESVGARERRS